MAERITFQLGEKYETLRNWLTSTRQIDRQDLPEFFSRCFGELLSQKGFGFHRSYDMADATDRLIESAREFGDVIQPTIWWMKMPAQNLCNFLKTGSPGLNIYHPGWMNARMLYFFLRHLPSSCATSHANINSGWIREYRLVGTAEPAANPSGGPQSELAVRCKMDGCRRISP